MADRPELSTTTLKRKLGNRTQLRGNDAYRLGNQLKEDALPSGRFFESRISDVGTLMEALSRFFYQKQHEWVALCLLDSSLTCRLVWVNKGANRAQVENLLSPNDVIELAPRYDARHVVNGHNHPVSSKDRPDYGSRRANIRASYQHKESLKGFSDQDYTSRAWWQQCLSGHALTFTDAVFVAGDYQIEGHSTVVDAYKANRPTDWKVKHRQRTGGHGGGSHHGRQECFIAGHVYGEDHPNTERLRNFRDGTLLESWTGRRVVDLYYELSPWICRILDNSRRLANLTRKLLDRIVKILRSD